MKRKNKIKNVGIIGGGGPMAGVFLAKYIVEICQKDYGCKDDEDFPHIILDSVPFAQMLRPGTQDQKEDAVRRQLEQSIDFLNESKADVIGMACNTLHAFLPQDLNSKQFVHLVETTRTYLQKKSFSKVLVLGSQTSANEGVHSFEGAVWASSAEQKMVDEVIDEILKGNLDVNIQNRFLSLVERSLNQHPDTDAFVLGCSEFSILFQNRSETTFFGRVMVDPLKLLAVELSKRSFLAPNH